MTVPELSPDAVVEALQGTPRGAFVGLAVAPGVGLGLAAPSGTLAVRASDPVAVVTAVEAALRPRWVWWSGATPAVLVAAGVRVATCWDLAAVHRLLAGGWAAEPGRLWAWLAGLGQAGVPTSGQLDLLAALGGGDDAAADGDGGDPEDPVRPDGHLRPEWTGGGWARTPPRLARWAGLAVTARDRQQSALDGLTGATGVGGDPPATARSESAAELLCVELAADGLPVDRARAEELIAAIVGPRPRDAHEQASGRSLRDSAVLRHVPGVQVDLRHPAQVRALLANLGIDVPDTRSWRLEAQAGRHPVVEALLAWRRAERIATTYGYGWLDTHVGADGRLRGAWSGSDGAAGRMTAQAGLHNLPGELRPAVAAGDGHVLVRADLGQIEPRILAAVSGDPALVAATAEDDLYAPVAARLGVLRPVAKVAVLAAMYGQTSGAAGETLTAMTAAYPVAMAYLRAADDTGRAGRGVRTHGGRLIPVPAVPAGGPDDPRVRAARAARGRFTRNAVVQGAAAEFFKAWAVTVRARAAPAGGRVVLCLHDELLVHTPVAAAARVEAVLHDCLQETARRWTDRPVRFVADVGSFARWSDAK